MKYELRFDQCKLVCKATKLTLLNVPQPGFNIQGNLRTMDVALASIG